jgi:hypothetical protein
VTRRTTNRQKLVEAAAAARTADDWIGAARRKDAVTAIIGASSSASTTTRLLQHERVRRRFPAFAAELSDAIKAKPKLGSCVRTPEALYQLSLMTGAGLAGGTMTRLVSRQSVSTLIAALGQKVWQYGVDHGASLDTPQSQKPDDIIALIEDEGCGAVVSYLEDISTGLGIAAFDAAGLPYTIKISPQDRQTSKAAVQGAMEQT